MTKFYSVDESRTLIQESVIRDRLIEEAARGGERMSDTEGPRAREYREGRAEQVKQQRIANLIALSASPHLNGIKRRKLADEAYESLREDSSDV